MGKSANIIQKRVRINIFGNVVSAGNVTHHDWRYTGNEHSVKQRMSGRRLDHLEQCPKRTFFKNQGFIPLLFVLLNVHHDLIGKVVIFIDQQVYRMICHAHGGYQGLNGNNGIIRINPDIRNIVIPVIFYKIFNAAIDMIMQGPPDVCHIPKGFHAGKIPLEDKIPVVQRGGVFADIEISEHLVKVADAGQIIIVEQGGQQQAFAKAPGPDEQ